MTKQIHPLQIVVAAGLLLAAGCDWLRPGGPPDEAYVEIMTEDVSQLTVVISQNFYRFQDESCIEEPDCPVHLVLEQADTLVVSAPYSSAIEFTDRHQLFIETHPLDEVEAEVGMTVKIDGRDWYEDLRILSPENEDGERDTLRFLYQYRERNTGAP